MKVITLIQPWATLITLGEKKIETRSWKTKYRGNLLIHAGKKIDKDVCNTEPYKSILEKHGYNSSNLPTGVILSKCNLINCLKMIKNTGQYAILEDNTIVENNEYNFGFYDVSRYGWILEDIKPLNEPINAKGQLNLWNYDIEERL